MTSANFQLEILNDLKIKATGVKYHSYAIWKSGQSKRVKALEGTLLTGMVYKKMHFQFITHNQEFSKGFLYVTPPV